MISINPRLRIWMHRLSVSSLLTAMAMMGGTAVAQAPINGQPVHKLPGRPTISPYLNLGRDNSGVLPSYQAFVIPQIEQNQQLANQWRLMNQNRNLEQSIGADANLRQTGHGGKFQNTLHFYPTQKPRK